MSADYDIDAAEYVLGTLSAEERAAFAALVARDASARQALHAWEARLAPLNAAVPEIAPPPAVWDAIEASLDNLPRFTVLEGGQAADITIAKLQRSRARWRGGALAAGALAASLAFLVTDRALLHAPQQPKSYIAAVNRGGDQPALIVRVDLATGNVFVRPVAAEVPSGKSLELWYIGEGKAPKSMGLIDKDPLKMPVPGGATVDKATFAVTVEPQGGSPTGGPTGPIVYSGQLIQE
ncbi:MAG TPA: anti-sigma factor [Beijerinckia sp.]|jgi:anti-sigma-K factor RskA|nr:anti-sigma factor [Beijerinckia sp.]